MKETTEKNFHLALRNRPWGVSAAKIDLILPCSRSGCSVPLQRSPFDPLPSASPRRGRDLALGVSRSGIESCGATIRRSVGVAMRHLDYRLMSPDTPLPRSGNYAPALSCTGLRISLVRVTSCHPRPLRCLPVGPGRTVPWVPWRPPYTIMPSEYGMRRPPTFVATPLVVFW